MKKWELDRISHLLDNNINDMLSTKDTLDLLEYLCLHQYYNDGLEIMTILSKYKSFHELCKVCLRFVEDIQSTEDVKQVSSAKDVKQVSGKEELREAFYVFEKEGDGFITPSKLQNALLNLGFTEVKYLENCEAMMTKFDINYSDKIEFDDFGNMMRIVKWVLIASQNIWIFIACQYDSIVWKLIWIVYVS